MAEEKQDKLPLDAKLLSDAVIELNISRHSVGLYPPEHPIVKSSIERAFGYLQKLFELRPGITLGITKDSLVIDEYTLDRRNPVFRQFAQALHTKGIAALSFSQGLDQGEIGRLHALISAKEGPIGKELVEAAGRELPHVTLSPIDLGSFSFVEGGRRAGTSSGDLWEGYVFGLLQGKLGEGDNARNILAAPPEAVAACVNSTPQEELDQASYDRVITAYMKKSSDSRTDREAYEKFFSFLDKLRPEVKAMTGKRFAEDLPYIESVMEGMSQEGFGKIADLLAENSSIIPTTLKNLIDKLSSIKELKSSYFDFFLHDSAVLHDIELGDDVIKLFGEDNFHAYVGKEYREELERMLKAKPEDKGGFAAYREECADEVVEEKALQIMLDLMHVDYMNQEDCLTLINRLAEYMNVFAATGRFDEILETYDTLSSQVKGGKFGAEAPAMVEDFFRSEEFVRSIVEAFRLWGRKEREGASRLARALGSSVIDPLLDSLEVESDPTARKFLLSMLEAIGSDVLPYALRRLDDKRWFIVRNMICLIRDCDGKAHAERIRKFLRHDNVSIRLEALKTVLHFNTPDSIPQLRACILSDIEDIRKGAIRLAGAYRVAEMVPYLIRYLQKRDLLGTEAYYKTDLVRALGDIGDVRALEPLEEICRSRALIYRDTLESLKVEIFRTLENYPPKAVRKLQEFGLASKNEEIRSLCAKQLSGGSGRERKGDS